MYAHAYLLKCCYAPARSLALCFPRVFVVDRVIRDKFSFRSATCNCYQQTGHQLGHLTESIVSIESPQPDNQNYLWWKPTISCKIVETLWSKTDSLLKKELLPSPTPFRRSKLWTKILDMVPIAKQHWEGGGVGKVENSEFRPKLLLWLNHFCQLIVVSLLKCHLEFSKLEKVCYGICYSS